MITTVVHAKVESKTSRRFLFCAFLVAALMVVYAQTSAFAWDEGFHLLAAQLIKSGRKPYLDFAFAQTPLNAYWNAAWMRLLGESWRAVQVIDALLTTFAIMLAADFLRSRWKGHPAWAVMPVFVLAGANPLIVEFGTIGQAYATGLLLAVASFRLAVAAVRQKRTIFAGLAGLLSSAAAGCSLLTAPVAPVLLVWSLIFSPRGKRVFCAVAFLSGAMISQLPLLILFVQSPQRVIFDVFRYHMFYRRSDWPGATQHDIELYFSWVASPQALILGALTAAGLWFIARKSGWDLAVRREFYLCGWLALALGLYVSTAHPTFTQYYLFTVPFLAILSSVGLFFLGVHRAPQRPQLLAFGVCLLTCLGLAKELYDRRADQSWPNMELVAHKVDEVTPGGAPLYADEHVYFLTRRTPPPGNEYLSSHKLRLPPELSESVHIVPQPEFDQRIQAGVYDTVETCEEDDWIKQRKLEKIYSQKAEVGDCAVFWAKTLKK
jgi:hypothetical protein